jgi:hypothetical protein
LLQFVAVHDERALIRLLPFGVKMLSGAARDGWRMIDASFSVPGSTDHKCRAVWGLEREGPLFKLSTVRDEACAAPLEQAPVGVTVTGTQLSPFFM